MEMEMEMEMEKRKRSDYGEVDGRRTKVKEDHEGDLRAEEQVATEVETEAETETATEEEVEEFYTIIRRVHEVVRYFGGKRKGSEGEETAKKKGGSWTPSFRWEDFEEVMDVNVKGKKTKKIDGEAVEEESHVVSVSLDLNVEPEPGPEMI
ncbi:protein NEGATIVE REGULATOR OF RESISTANCE [Telopea speciosissima]|uniref:protein NEGATIVE REGULATOR OF RESISTANCE n=1 Tax=Telopea speciosissima TaxID=54955 RepID=UPI001CC3987F|nr:protein NEGATIVE REGULATOR OF RESISTANCE [Telopea speciosissima]